MRAIRLAAPGSDLAIAMRSLRANRGFALVAGLTIAVAIAANSLIFGVIQAVLLKPLPYADPERLSIIWNDFGHGQSLPAVSGPDFLDYRARASDVADFAAASSGRANLHGAEGDPELVEVGTATAGLFSLLGIKPALGRLFTPDEAVPNGARVAVLSHRFWVRRFGADRSMVGRSILINGEPRTADARALLRPAERAVRAVDPQLALRQLRLLAELVDEARGPTRFVTALGSLFGALALGMAALGLFGVLSFSVRQRKREIGVRMALGAGEARVLRMVVGAGYGSPWWERRSAWEARSSVAGPWRRPSKE